MPLMCTRRKCAAPVSAGNASSSTSGAKRLDDRSWLARWRACSRAICQKPSEMQTMANAIESAARIHLRRVKRQIWLSASMSALDRKGDATYVVAMLVNPPCPRHEHPDAHRRPRQRVHARRRRTVARQVDCRQNYAVRPEPPTSDLVARPGRAHVHRDAGEKSRDLDDVRERQGIPQTPAKLGARGTGPERQVAAMHR